MAKLGKVSEWKLMGCHPDLQRLVREVYARLPHPYDLAVTDGHRGEKAQNAAFAAGRSSKEWPYSKHNELPSRAVDLAPYPIDWNDRERFVFLMGFVKAVAVDLGIEIRLGMDWNSDSRTSDERFRDYPHVELV
jgi:peptidoglycan L-alanyl-D-glutamate endopeptidase CwlK